VTIVPEEVSNQAGATGQLPSPKLKKTTQMLGTTTSYRHFSHENSTTTSYNHFAPENISWLLPCA